MVKKENSDGPLFHKRKKEKESKLREPPQSDSLM